MNSTILVLAPHADDEILGVGATMARAVAEGSRVVAAVLTTRAEGTPERTDGRPPGDLRAECVEAARTIGHTVVFEDLPAVCLDHEPISRANAVVLRLVKEHQPDEIYVPYAHDLHRDHGAIAYAASVATRPYIPDARCVRRVLAYETLSETHLAPPGTAPAFTPNVYVDVTDTLEKKLEAMSCYGSQLQGDDSPRSLAALRALSRVRGTHVGVAAAEAFMLLHETVRR